MAKSLLRLKARKLRQRGISVKKIAQYLGISKSTTSVWVRDIVLSVEQLESLRRSSLLGAERGRLKNALMQKEKWQKHMEKARQSGIVTIGNLTNKEFLITGLALYWAEGCKKTRKVEFCNSDPTMIRLLICWLQKYFDILSEDIRCVVGINEMHMKREGHVKEYWSKISGIPLSQFRKTSFKRVTNKKIYDNFNDHYGTLSVHVVKPARFYGKIMGLIDGLRLNLPT